jgi:DNA polymerase-3 subunit delta'
MDDNWNILGHAWAVAMLCRQNQQGTLRHAYLFTGPPGVGRRTLALSFAQALNCTEPVQSGIPCGGMCRDCQQIERLQHPDVTVFQADAEGGSLEIAKVRELLHSLMFKPYQSKYRVAVFLRFQEATPGAANALLKTLEEAPPYAVLILTAESPEQLLPTIVSRCEILRLRPLPTEMIEGYLIQRGVLKDQARLISRISGGRPSHALGLLTDSDALAFRDEKLRELEALLPATRAAKFAYAENLYKDKAAMRSTLMLWLSFWRDVLWRASGASTPLTNIDRTQQIEALAGRVDLADARRLVAALDKALKRLEDNINARLLAEVLLLDLPT